MTTVTPSDQAGAASAKRPATIPAQRSGQALRLLVLGTGEGAAAFRARAAEAGAELAQRFSVRVTHVVVEEGVGEGDARVVRARGAGLPVLGLDEGTALIEEQLASGGGELEVEEGEVDGEQADGDRAEAGAGTGTGVTADAGASVGVSADGVDAADVSAGAGAGAGVIEKAGVGAAGARSDINDEDEDEDIDDDGDDVDGDGDLDDVVPLIRPRTETTETAPAAVDGGPSDVFAGSALEAVLQFPALRTNKFGSEDGGADVTAGAATAADDAVGVDDGAQSALMDVVSAECACAETEVGTARELEWGTDIDGSGGATTEVAAGSAAGSAAVRAGEWASAAGNEAWVVGGSAAGDGASVAGGSAAGEAESAREVGAAHEVWGAREAELAREVWEGDGVETGSEVGAAGDREWAAGVGGRVAAAAGAAAAASGSGAPEDGRSAAWRASSVAWALVPLVSLGLLTPVAIGYAAYRLRSRSLAVATVGYSVAIVAAFAGSAVVPVHSGAYSVVGDLLTTCLAAAWLGGTAHCFLIRRRVFGLFR